MPTINDINIIGDTTIRLRSLIGSGVTDPLSSRPDGSFIMTSWPKRKITYPLITIRATLGTSEHLGMQSEGKLYPINVFIDVWTKDVAQRDRLSGSVIEILRLNQYGVNSTGNTGSSTTLERLYDFKLLNAVALDEPGIDGVHRMTIEAQYKYVTQA